MIRSLPTILQGLNKSEAGSSLSVSKHRLYRKVIDKVQLPGSVRCSHITKVKYVTMSLRLGVAIPTTNRLRSCDVFDMTLNGGYQLSLFALVLS